MATRGTSARILIALTWALATAAAQAADNDSARVHGSIFHDALKDGTKGPEMVALQSGCYQMGSSSQEDGRYNNERQHEVCVDAVAIGRYEVTFEAFDRFARATARQRPGDAGLGRGNRPVVDVSWNDAVAYAEWLSAQTGETYRLPSEAEWEYAARAGTSTAYWWGNRTGAGNANCDGCGSPWDRRQTAPVGHFQPNPFGLYDTAGNVLEWTCSLYGKEYDGSEVRCVSENDGDGYRPVRGGSWNSSPRWARSAFRFRYEPGGRFNDCGFRLARILTP